MKKMILGIGMVIGMITSAFAQIGSLATDLVFTPIVPCRIVDTRNAGGAIIGGTSRVFKGWAATYAAQGGTTNTCGLPQTSDIAALSVNLAVVGTAGDGWIAAWPVGTTQPLVSNLNYGAGAVLANSAILKINQTTNDWNLHTTQTTHFVADVTGYFSKPISTGSLDCTTPAFSTTALAAGASTTVYAPTCTLPYIETGTNCATSSADIQLNYSGWGQCGAKNSSASSGSIYASTRCCRVPGR